MNVTLKQVVYFGVASLSLIALAGPMPDVATGFIILLMLGTVITHYKDLAPYFALPK